MPVLTGGWLGGHGTVCGEMGIGVFVVLAVIVAYLSNSSLKLLALCVLHTKQSCYQGVGRAAFGWRGATVTSVFIILQVWCNAAALS